MSNKILVLTPRFPYPLEGGDKIRIYYVAKSLKAAGFELDLISFVTDEKEAVARQAPELTSIFSNIQTVVLPKWRSHLNVYGRFFSKIPLQVLYYHSQEMKIAVERACAKNAYAGVLAHLIRMAPYALQCKAPKKVLEMTDALSLNYARSNEQKRIDFLGIAYKFEEKRVKEYEKECIRDFDEVVLVSAVDRDYLKQDLDSVLSQKLKVIPIGVPGEIQNERAKPRDPELIVFIGNLRTRQNTDAVLFFIKDIYPWIKAQRFPVKFRVIGANPPKEILAMNGKMGVEVTGRVENIYEYAAKASVSVCPVRIGAGMQGKILESMAMQIPVVTTSLAAKSISGIYSGKNCFIVDTPQDFARAVIQLLEDQDLNEKIAKNGRDLVSANYRYEIVAKSYASFFNAS